MNSEINDLSTSTTSSSHTQSQSSQTLWVDRYRPHKFTELIGDDRVHREVMAWVKEWDYCVFGKGKGKGVKRNRTFMEGNDENMDEWRRPNEKVPTLPFTGSAS